MAFTTEFYSWRKFHSVVISIIRVRKVQSQERILKYFRLGQDRISQHVNETSFLRRNLKDFPFQTQTQVQRTVDQIRHRHTYFFIFITYRSSLKWFPSTLHLTQGQKPRRQRILFKRTGHSSFLRTVGVSSSFLESCRRGSCLPVPSAHPRAFHPVPFSSFRRSKPGFYSDIPSCLWKENILRWGGFN